MTFRTRHNLLQLQMHYQHLIYVLWRKTLKATDYTFRVVCKLNVIHGYNKKAINVVIKYEKKDILKFENEIDNGGQTSQY